MAPPLRETVGNIVGLCLLIDFSDEPAYSGFGNNGSVFDYFSDNSIGRCRYTNIVADYYQAQHPRSHYTDPNITQGVRAHAIGTL